MHLPSVSRLRLVSRPFTFGQSPAARVRLHLFIPQALHRIAQRRPDRLDTHRRQRNPKGRQARK